MKILKVLICALALISLVGCNGKVVQIQTPQMANVAIELAGFNLGYFVGKDQPDADILVRNAYTFARTGQLTPEAVAQGMAELKIKDPLLAGNLLIMVKAMGASVDVQGQIIDIKQITPEMWDAAAAGYTQGFAIGQAKRG